MTRYAQKVLSGEQANNEDWIEYLKTAHDKAPSMTPKAFDAPRTATGLNSYQVLVNAIDSIDGTPMRLLDLACGDGHLIRYIRTEIAPDCHIVGVDLSARELEIARSQYAGSDTTFRCESADAISEPNESFDVVLCHMAFMLMSPIEPVTREVARLLRPGGTFAGVISGKPADGGFFATYTQEISSFIKRRFPSFTPSAGGDPRTRTVDGMKEILSPPGFPTAEVTDFEVRVKGTPGDAWSFFENMYSVTLLPDAVREEFRSVLISRAEMECRAGALEFGFPMRLFKTFKSDRA